MRYFVCCVLALSLVACTQDKNATPPPQNTSPKSPAKVSIAPSTQLSSSPIPPIFDNLGDCEKSGATLPSCARAQNVARVMAHLDAPKFSSQANCAKVFQNCVVSSGKFLPQFTSFGLGGNSTTAPSPDAPAEITPVYTTKEGVPVIVFETSTNLYNVIPTDGKTQPFSFQTK